MTFWTTQVILTCDLIWEGILSDNFSLRTRIFKFRVRCSESLLVCLSSSILIYPFFFSHAFVFYRKITHCQHFCFHSSLQDILCTIPIGGWKGHFYNRLNFCLDLVYFSYWRSLAWKGSVCHLTLDVSQRKVSKMYQKTFL